MTQEEKKQLFSDLEELSKKYDLWNFEIQYTTHVNSEYLKECYEVKFDIFNGLENIKQNDTKPNNSGISLESDILRNKIFINQKKNKLNLYYVQ